MPHAGGGLHQRLVSVEVILGDEVITQSHRVTEVGDERVLVEEVCCVGTVRAEVERRFVPRSSDESRLPMSSYW